MKINKIKIGATIPVQKYGNIIPEIEISTEDRGEDLIGAGMSVIKNLFSKYSEAGELTEKEIVKLGLCINSFNEEGIKIEFEPVSHTYFYQEKQLTGVTEYIKKFYKPFDTETISSILESKWGIPKKVIEGMWKINGDITSDFGTVVHKLLEYYEKYKSFGDIISSKQQIEDNYCLPKHPVLRKIITEFLLMPQQKGEVVTEALVSSIKDNICGQADRIKIIDKDKKICRVGDIKVNINSEGVDKKYKILPPFETLPSNKLSKYQLQMSVYANMLQKSGWVVEGLDVYVYEDGWKYFELPVLKVI